MTHPIAAADRAPAEGAERPARRRVDAERLRPLTAVAGWIGARALGAARALATAGRSIAGERGQETSPLVRQVFATGVRALPLVCAVGLGSGVAIVLQTGIMAPPPSGELGRMLVVVVLRELSPLVTAIVVAGHSGAGLTGLAASEPEAPAWPRIGALAIATPVLTIYFAAVAVTGGYLVSQLLTLRTFEAVRAGLVQELAPSDLVLFLVKTAGLGAIVGLCALRAGRRPADEDAPGRAFAATLLVAMLYSGAVTVAFYLWRGPPLPP